MIRAAFGAALLALFLAAPALAQDWGELATPVSPVNLRQSRDLKSASRDVLMPGEVVRMDFLEDGWYAVFRSNAKVRDESKALGYVRAGFLKPASAGNGKAPAKAAAAPKLAPAKVPAVAPKEPRLEPVAPPAALTKTALPAWGRLVSLPRRVDLSRRPNPFSGQVRSLERGAWVRVDFLEQGWYAVFAPEEPEQDKAKAWGFATAEAIDGPSAAPASQARPLEEPEEEKPELPAPAPATAPAPAAPAPAVATPPPAMTPPPAKAQPTLRTPERPLAVASPFVQRNPEIPSGDKTLHGFRYAVLDTDEERVNGVSVIEIKVYLDVTVLPEREAIKNFATSIWREKRQGGRELVVDVFLPDTDLKGLPYAVARYDDNGLQEYFTRRTILFGTRFAR